MTTLVRPLARLYLKLRYQVLSRRHRRLVLEQVEGLALLVLPEVFNPGLFRTSGFLVQTMRAACRGPLPAGAAALDVGTGSGVAAIAAARLGYRVAAVDISQEAVRNARINVLLNRVEGQVRVCQGDLFAPVAGERFDLVLFNPPFYQGTPRDWLDHAWRGQEVFERFADGLRAVFAPGALALVVLSTDGEGDVLLGLLRSQGYTVRAAARRDAGNEVLTVYAVSAGP